MKFFIQTSLYQQVQVLGKGEGTTYYQLYSKFPFLFLLYGFQKRRMIQVSLSSKSRSQTSLNMVPKVEVFVGREEGHVKVGGTA